MPLQERSLWFARHGNRYDFLHPEYFIVADRPYDPPLSSEGHVQARELAARLREEAIAEIICSPYLRAVQTAAPLATALAMPLYLEAGLGEWLNPDWMRSPPRLMAVADLQRHYSCVEVGYRSYQSPTYPEASLAEAEARFGRTLRHLLDRTTGNLVLVGHAFGAAAVAAALDIADPPAFDTSPCSLLQFVETASGWQVLLAGDTAHLSQPGVTVCTDWEDNTHSRS